MSSLKLPKFNFHAARWTIEGNMEIGTGKTLTILSKNCVLIIFRYSNRYLWNCENVGNSQINDVAKELRQEISST